MFVLFFLEDRPVCSAFQPVGRGTIPGVTVRQKNSSFFLQQTQWANSKNN